MFSQAFVSFLILAGLAMTAAAALALLGLLVMDFMKKRLW